ncbi:FAD binding domain-containing protein [Arthroderma uncinatum]|uniref:FAD binding domain-containing protein n=1 Tax=Arthroderma uncinatum TaxID=74035 RepID=UPI00144A8901|nr:FAD binding domain-containing protein [Arthroderma uncinatum]KAF3491549.1 FAD binding domain-containing protein [Arthroderma uncinatum]
MLSLVFALVLPILGSFVLGLSLDDVRSELGPQLSGSAVVSENGRDFARWSDYHAPTAGVVVTVACEQDVAVTVQYCIEHEIQFLAQAGTHGFTTTIDLDDDGILINLRQLNSVTFNDDKTEVTVGGGALISEVIEAASSNNTLVATGNCNCVGAVGAILGGGYGSLMGLYGFGVDNVLSLNVVSGDGVLKTVTFGDDLFWALRGAGPNFGIVTSARMKSYPREPSKQYAWVGALTFTGDKIEAVAKAISEITLTAEMNIYMFFLDARAPDKKPTIILTPWYYGTEAEGRAAFASVIDIGPTLNTMAETHYTHWNDGSESACIKGGRKPSYAAGLAEIVPETWKQVWDEYVSWVSSNDGRARNSTVILEAYSMAKAGSIADSSSSFPWRSRLKFNALIFPCKRTRSLLQSTSGLYPPATYVNFAHGDEDLSEIYGHNLPRLREIKAKEDEYNIFDQSFYLGPSY